MLTIIVENGLMRGSAVIENNIDLNALSIYVIYPCTSQKCAIRIHISEQCRFTHFCQSNRPKSILIYPEPSEKSPSFSQYIMTRKLSRNQNPTKVLAKGDDFH
jgi:hypothetical protein